MRSKVRPAFRYYEASYDWLRQHGKILLQSVLKAEKLKTSEFSVYDRKPERRQALGEKYPGLGLPDNPYDCVNGADYLLLAIKPYQYAAMLAEVRDSISKDTVIISIAAGIGTEHLKRWIDPNVKAVITMPNTPALVNKGLTAISYGEGLSAEEMAFCRGLFECVGEVVEIEEKLMYVVPSISASAPAYIYVLIEAMADGGVMQGLPRDLAYKMAALTVEGSARMVLDTGKHPGELKDLVTSPGGTTIVALKSLENDRFRATIMNAMEAGTKRVEQMMKGQQP
jgi:pyrroline-5-carboxylate reductase